MSRIAKKISTDIIVSVLLEFSARIRGIVYLALVTSSLGVAAYGAFMQMKAIVSILSLISMFGLREAFENLSQNENIDSRMFYYSILSITTTAGIFVGIFVFSFSVEISNLTLGNSDYSSIFAIGSILIPVECVGSISRGYYRAEMRVKTGAVLRSLLDYLEISAVLVSIYIFNSTLENTVFTIVAVQVVYVVMIQSMVSCTIGFKLPTFENIPAALRYSVWIVVSRISGQLSSRADRLLLGYFVGASAVGTYSIAYGLASLLLTLVSPIQYTLFPEFSRLLEDGEKSTVEKYTGLGIKYFLLLAIPGLVGLHFVSEPILQLITSNNEAVRASTIVPILGIGIVMFGLDKLQGVSLIAAKMTKPVSLIRSVNSAMNILLNIVLIPFFGVTGSAIATGITYTISCSSIHLLLIRKFQIMSISNDIFKIGFATFGMAIILILLPTWNILLTILVGIIFYATLLVSIGGLDLDQIRMVFHN